MLPALLLAAVLLPLLAGGRLGGVLLSTSEARALPHPNPPLRTGEGAQRHCVGWGERQRSPTSPQLGVWILFRQALSTFQADDVLSFQRPEVKAGVIGCVMQLAYSQRR
jgi:hypothetical protein